MSFTFRQVEDVAGLRFDGTAHRYFEDVVVAVPVRVVALAEEASVLQVTEFGIVNPVRGVEGQPAVTVTMGM
jgi:hypothetical protein